SKSTLPMPDREPDILANQKPSTTVESNTMDKLETTILKKAIEAIPLLTINFESTTLINRRWGEVAARRMTQSRCFLKIQGNARKACTIHS
ncbi:hypothetical protein VP01_4075g1, partial [Puccinia sorghi]